MSTSSIHGPVDSFQPEGYGVRSTLQSVASGAKSAYGVTATVVNQTKEVVKTYADIMDEAAAFAGDIGETGLAAGTTLVKLSNRDFTPLKSALGYKDLKKAGTAYKLKPTKVIEINGKEFIKEDMRSFPERVGDSVGHLAYGVTKAISATTYTTALAVGTVSNLAGFEAASPLSFHGGAKGLAHVTSYMTQGAWWATKQVAYAGQNALTTTLSNTNYIKAATLTTGLGFTLYKVGSNLRAAGEADNMEDKFKASAAAAAWTAASIALPILTFAS